MADLYRNPTLEGAQRLETLDKKCGVCVRRMEVFDGEFGCSGGKRWPVCRGQKGGFVLDVIPVRVVKDAREVAA